MKNVGCAVKGGLVCREWHGVPGLDAPSQVMSVEGWLLCQGYSISWW